MRTRVSRRRAGVWAGVLGVLALAGCGPEPKRVAQVPQPETPPVVTTPTESSRPADPTPPQPGVPGVPGGIPFQPTPSVPATTPPTPAFVPPTSPTFTPPEALPGAQVPGTTPAQPPQQPPKPEVPQPPVPQPPDPAKPANPTGTLQPETPKPTTPPEVKYPTQVGGRDLKGWLDELRYTGGGPIQKDDQVRETAVKIIPSFGPDARKPAVVPLVNAIRSDPDPGVQIAAITVVSNMGFEMRAEMKPVMDALQNKLGTAESGNIVKMYCVRSLASFGPDAAASIPYFKKSCLDPSWETRREIAVALSLVGATPVDDKGKPKKDSGPDMRAIEILLDFQMQDRSVTVRMEAAKSLLALGPPFAKTPQEFIKDTEKPRETMDKVVKFEGGKGPKVSTRFATPDRGVYVWALLLQLMYDDRKVPDNLLELAKLVKEPDGPRADEVRLFAIQAIGAAGSLFPALVEKDRKLDDKNKVAAKVIAAVTDALNYDHEPVLQYTAMTTLALIGKSADTAVPALERLAAKSPKPPPPDAPKGTKPDDSMQRMAKQTVEVIVGRRKFDDFGKEDPKPGEKKDDVKAAPPK